MAPIGDRHKLSEDLLELAERASYVRQRDAVLLARAAAAVTTLPELLGGHQVAEVLGVGAPNLPKIPDLPAPVLDLPRGRLWLGSDIRKFAKVFKKRRGDA